MGTNEKLIGELLKDPAFQSKVFICTGFGPYFTDSSGMDVLGKPEYVRKCVNESLANLQVDTIGLYYQHRVDRTITIEETWKELKKLKEEGKVRYLGISEATSEEIRRAHAVTPISALQIEVRLLSWKPNLATKGKS